MLDVVIVHYNSRDDCGMISSGINITVYPCSFYANQILRYMVNRFIGDGVLFYNPLLYMVCTW